MQTEQGLVQLDVGEVLLAFHDWFTQGYADLPSDPWHANSQQEFLCTVRRTSSGLLLMTLIATMVDGCWCALPDYVSHTAGIPSQHVRSLAAFRLGAHHYEVATGRWTTNTPRSDRVCKLCCQGVAEGRLGSVGPTLLVTSFMLFLSVVSKKCLAVCMLLFLSVLFCKSL